MFINRLGCLMFFFGQYVTIFTFHLCSVVVAFKNFNRLKNTILYSPKNWTARMEKKSKKWRGTDEEDLEGRMQCMQI
jgi:hypothetical protein